MTECPTCGAGRNQETDDLYARLDRMERALRIVASRGCSLRAVLGPSVKTCLELLGEFQCGACIATKATK